MPNTPIRAENAASPLERRSHTRREVLAIAYCDVGTDNGGIVINLSEGGLALQAAGPLDSQTTLNLRVRVPGCQARIQIAAQVAWLGNSNRRAGVRFAEMSLEERAQIDEWVRLNMLPSPPSPHVAPEPRKGLGQQESNRESGKDKWVTFESMADVGVPGASVTTPVPKSQKETGRPPVEPDPVATYPESELAFDLLDQRAMPVHDTRPEGIPLLGTSDQPHGELPKSGSGGDRLEFQSSDLAAITLPNDDQIHSQVVRDSIFPPYRTASTTVPERSHGLDTTLERFSSSVDSEKDSVAELRSAILPAPAVAARKWTRQWNLAVVLFGSFSLLTFAIGAWFGSSRTSVHSVQTVQTLTLPATAAPAIGPTTTGSDKLEVPELRKPAPATVSRPRSKGIGGSSASGNPRQNLEPPLPVPSLAPVSTAPVKPVHEEIDPMPADHGISQPETTKPLENSPPLAPTPDDSATEVPTPRIVAGRALRPTDRFNPSHLTYRVEPAYPSEARRQGIEGAVKLHLIIGADGTVRSVAPLSGSPLLTPAAMDAAKYWQYLPALLNGQPVETEVDVEIEFRLPH